MPGKDNLSFERERKKREKCQRRGAFVILNRNKCEAKKKSCHCIRLIKLAQT